MQVIVTGKQVNIGESLMTHIEEKTQDSVSKYSDRINKVKVVVSKEGHEFRVDISGNVGTHAGLAIKARTTAADPYVAFDTAIEKVEKQLRRYKRQITNHHAKQVVEDDGFAGTHYVISSEEEEEVAADNPVIIAETPTNIERLTVSDAVMRMDLGELAVLMFINDANGRMNVIMRRPDGNITWLDPNTEAEQSVAA